MRVVILGAGFGGLELATSLSESLGDAIDVTLIDKSDSFIFGYSKLDVMFGKVAPNAIRLPYSAFKKTGVRFCNETILAIDPTARIVETDAGQHQADILVVALGADYAPERTPGLSEWGNEFYSVAGAIRDRELIPTFTSGKAVVVVAGPQYKCPPAPSEAAFMLHDSLVARGLRDQTDITVISPLPTPVPVTPEVGAAFLAAYAERGITYIGSTKITAIEDEGHAVVLPDGSRVPADMLLSVPIHVAPQVVQESGMCVEGWVPTDKYTLQSPYPDVFALGDVASVGVPRAGIFSEGQAKIVARQIIARVRGGESDRYQGIGQCYVEFGSERIGMVDVNFLGGPQQTATYHGASRELRQEKTAFGAERRRRWFNLP